MMMQGPPTKKIRLSGSDVSDILLFVKYLYNIQVIYDEQSLDEYIYNEYILIITGCGGGEGK